MTTTYGELDGRSGVPFYRQIKKILAAEIESGVLDPAEPLTDAALLNRFGVSRAPIRQALTELSKEGYVYRRPGRGTFPIAGVRVEQAPENRPGYLYEYLDRDGAGTVSHVSDPERVAPDPVLRARLHLRADERLFHFAHRIDVEGTPVVSTQIFVRAPEGFSPSASELEEAGSAFDLLERRFDIALERSEHEASAVAATPAQAADLRIAEGAPVLLIQTVFYSTGGVPAGYREVAQVTSDITFRFTTRR